MIHTYDYELFLGSYSGHLNEVLIQPTEKLLKTHEKFNSKAIFFVDTLYLIRLKEKALTSEGARIDFQLISNQLVEIAKQHEIYLHLHPHWLDAVYNAEKGIWDLSNHSRYTFEGFTSSEVIELFRKSSEIIKEIFSDPGYVSTGYRAGGWSIQPFSKFKDTFKKLGITTDYSVIPGKMYHSTAQKFDFLNAPKDKHEYQFSDCPSIEDINGEFKEIPISIYTISKYSYFIRKCYLSINYRLLKYFKKTKGSTVEAKILKEKSVYSKYTFVAQIENLDIFQLIGIYNKYKKEKYIHFVSHPKLMSRFDFFALKILFRLTKNG